MREFKDTSGRTWQLSISIGSIALVRDLLKVDIYGLFEKNMEPLNNLMRDPCQLVNVLYVLVKRQAEKAGVSDEDFGYAFDGDVLLAASDAFMEELVLFFPKQKKTLTTMLQKVRAIESRIQARADKEVENLNPDTLADSVLNQLTAAQASLASTLTLSP